MKNSLDPKKINSRKQGSVLSVLWRKIVTENHMQNNILHMIDLYAKNSAGSMKMQKRKTKSSLTKNIIAEDMTWNIFTDLMFNFLKIRKIRLDITLQFHSGNESMHHVVFDNGIMELEDDDEELDEVVPKEKTEKTKG